MNNKLYRTNAIFPTDDPYINIVLNPVTKKYSLSFHMWDTSEIVDGYSKSEAEELIGLIERGIFHLNSCIEESNQNQGNLFEEKENLNAEEETNTR